MTRFKEPYLELDTAGVIEPVLEGNGRKGGQLHPVNHKLAEKLQKDPKKLLAHGTVLVRTNKRPLRRRSIS